MLALALLINRAYNSVLFQLCTYIHPKIIIMFDIWIKFITNVNFHKMLCWMNYMILFCFCIHMSRTLKGSSSSLSWLTTGSSICECPILDNNCANFSQVSKYFFWVLLIRKNCTFCFLKSDFWYSKKKFLVQNDNNSKGYPLETWKIHHL